MKSISIIILLVLLTHISCGKAKKTLDPKFDDTQYQLIDKGFYKGLKDNKIYIKTSTVQKVDTVKTMVYFYQEVPLLDVPSFTRLMHAGYYAKDKNQVYTWETTGQGETIKVLPGADVKTFTSIGYRWAKDTNAVYYENKKMLGLNPAELSLVCFEAVDSSLIYISFIRDNDQLFYGDQEIKVPSEYDIQKIYCKEDLLGNSFLAIDKEIYIVKDGTMVPYD